MKARHLFETADPMTQRHMPEERNSQLSTLTLLSKFKVPELCRLVLVHSQFQLKFSPLFKVPYFLFLCSRYPDLRTSGSYEKKLHSFCAKELTATLKCRNVGD
jgi:hypothetical protein